MDMKQWTRMIVRAKQIMAQTTGLPINQQIAIKNGLNCTYLEAVTLHEEITTNESLIFA